jgi:hypothetical protein
MTNKRQYRNNHSIAESHLITDGKSAQAYCDALVAATKNDKPSVMFNSSGFVTPSILNNHSIENLVRMACSIVNAMACRIADMNHGESAQEALRIVNSYAAGAAKIQQNALDERILRQAEEIRKAKAQA